jgi:esterase/lipase superfamily enzyme
MPVKNQLGFVAADVDEQSFGAMTPVIRDANDRTLTLYSSDNDLALRVSKLIHPGQSRVGLIAGTPFNMPPFEVVDISRENSSFQGHSYLRVEPIVRMDIGKAILTRENASARGLYPHSRGGVKVYTFRK